MRIWDCDVVRRRRVGGLAWLISLIQRLRSAGIVFRKYKVAPRLGAAALRRRLLSRLRAHQFPAVFVRVHPWLE